VTDRKTAKGFWKTAVLLDVSILGVSLSGFQQADVLMNKAATQMAQASSASDSVVSGEVDLTTARLQENASVHVANAETQMNKALLDIFV
jgi:hypothetical protein